MGILDDIILGLLKIFCGGSSTAEPPQQQQQQTQPQEFPPLPHQQQPVSSPPQKPYQQDPLYGQGQQHAPSPPSPKPHYNVRLLCPFLELIYLTITRAKTRI